MPEQDPPAPEPTPDTGRTFTQADLDAKVEERLARERKKYSDYEDLRAKASKFDELEAASKSDLDKANERVAQLEKDLAAATARGDRFEVALEKGLDMTRAKRLTGATREELEADADELITWTAADKPAVPGKPAADLRGGGDPTEAPDVDIRQVVDSIPRGL